jgi:hypothetical protein
MAKIYFDDLVGRYIISDSYNYLWEWLGDLVRVVGDDTEDGGYQCATLEEALDILREEGYIE